MAVSIYQLEDALAKSFAGKVLKDRNGRDNYIPVFLDYPDIEEADERRFPSISLILTDMIPEVSMYDSQETYTVSTRTDLDVPVIQERRVPEYYRLVYEISTFALSAFEDRELMRWVESRFAPRDALKVGDGYYHYFRESFSVNDDVDIDTVVYNKTWTASVIADIEDTDNDSLEKGVREFKIYSNVVKTTSKIIPSDGENETKYEPYAPKGSETALGAEKTRHRIFSFDDQNYWFPKK
tara:strand:+ start:1510 stop:2226 length:717 start_codon:yes stop_codon:yes gene_type:complete